MKYLNFKTLLFGLLAASSISITSCKGKDKSGDVTTTTDSSSVIVAPVTPAPVTITADDSLKTGVADATKDYPGVRTEVNDGEITLTGELQRSKLPALMQTLNSLRPKKINNQLTLK